MAPSCFPLPLLVLLLAAALPVENGVPVCLATPIKLGYKLSTWVTAMTVAATLGERRGAWAVPAIPLRSRVALQRFPWAFER
ncbi:hypothetical protein [Synechococcus sp. CS-1328]|uniref:hypothetical protein n=1 Tax=Synechococcus sp. CS-1328 TaxID=2847976 RepID=UPI00223AE239|nr:hypothetical protein [Synechococcus sp. CS-1328]MCT0223962.1 hypothetical protein [Synechococcus sp. CS-1328]